MSNCCAPKTPFLPEQVLKAVEQIENLCSASKNPVCTPSLQANTQFGIIMDMSTDGSILVIGAPTFDAKDGNGVEQLDSGGVFVFKRKQSFAACAVAKKSASKYKLQQILVATDPKSCANEVQAGDRFGDSVSVSGAGSRIVVGATAQDVAGVSGVGSVYVFDQKSQSLLYKVVQKIVPEQTMENMAFGTDLALSKNGRVLLISTDFGKLKFYDDCLFRFTTDCFRRSNEAKNFVLTQTIDAVQIVQATAIPVQNVIALGRRLKLDQSGNTALISAPESTVVNAVGNDLTTAGIVFVVQRFADSNCSTGVTKWSTTQVLSSKDPQMGALFGTSFALTPSARFIAVEEPGRIKSSFLRDVGLVSVFEQHCAGRQYRLVAELCATGDDVRELLNESERSICISDDGCTIAVGYELSSISGAANAGTVIIFQRSCGSAEWKQSQTLTKFTPPFDNRAFGTGLAMSGDANSLAVGARAFNTDDFVFTFSSQFLRHC